MREIKKGIVEQPHLIMIAGTDGIGKSSFAGQAPNPIFLDVEGSSSNLDVHRFTDYENFANVIEDLDSLVQKPNGYKTVVIDSVDWLEKLLQKKICEDSKVKSIELAYGGYGKGYVRAAEMFQDEVSTRLMKLRTKGLNVILISHVEPVKRFDPSVQAEYDRYELKMHKRLASYLREFVDTLLFVNYEVFTKEENNRTKAFGDGARYMFTERRPGFDAKNRFGLPFKLPLSWDEYDMACKTEKLTPDKLLGQIKAMLEECDEELREKVTATLKKTGENVMQLEAIANRLRVRLEASSS